MGAATGFGGRVVISAVATVLLVMVILASPAAARLEARGAPPWPAPGSAHVAAGVRAAGLSLQTAPGEVVRYAVHLDVIVDGRRVTVPAGIGVDSRGPLIAALYTWDSSGIVHVASDSERSGFTLGQFFDEWQVALTPGHLGGLRVSGYDPVAIYVDGSRVAGQPGSVKLTPHLQIAVTYRPGPVPIPASYAFPAGT
jgi:hypothetical protein